MYDAKLSSRSVIHDSAGSAGRTMGIADSPSDIEESKHTHETDQRQGIYTYGEVLVAPRKEKSAQENEVERGCVGSLRSRARGTRSDQEAR